MDEETRRVMETGFDVLADLFRETNAELTPNRGELVMLKTEITEMRTDLSGRIDGLGRQVAQTNGRLDNLIAIAGTEVRLVLARTKPRPRDRRHGGRDQPGLHRRVGRGVRE